MPCENDYTKAAGVSFLSKRAGNSALTLRSRRATLATTTDADVLESLRRTKSTCFRGVRVQSGSEARETSRLFKINPDVFAGFF